jgi:hypothetical protein
MPPGRVAERWRVDFGCRIPSRIWWRVRFFDFLAVAVFSVLSSKACTYRIPKKVLDNRYTDMITSPMLPRRLTLPPHPPAKLTPSLSHSCSLLRAPQKVNSHHINSLQPLLQNTRVGGTSEYIRSLVLPPSRAPRSASIPCALSQLRILPIATGVYYPQHFHAQVSLLAFRFLSPLCFHILTNCFSRNPFLFTTIRIAPGCGGLCVLCVPTSVASVLSGFLQAGGEGSKPLVIRVNPFAGKVLGKWRNFIGELCERIEPRRRSRAGTV